MLMRKPLHEAQDIDRYLLQEMPCEDRLVFEARTIAAPVLQEKVSRQALVHRLVRWFGRERQKERLERIHRSLMQDEGFSNSIHTIFRK